MAFCTPLQWHRNWDESSIAYNFNSFIQRFIQTKNSGYIAVEIVKKTCYTIKAWNIFTQRLKVPVL